MKGHSIEELQALWESLRWEEWTTSDELAERLNTQFERTNLPVREMACCLNDLGFPVASSSRGFMRTREASALQSNLEHLQSRCEGINRRMDSIRRIIREMSSPLWEPGEPEDMMHEHQLPHS